MDEIFRLNQCNSPIETRRPTANLISFGNRIVLNLVIAVRAHAPLVPFRPRNDFPRNSIRRGERPARYVVVPDVAFNVYTGKLVAFLRIHIKRVIRDLVDTAGIDVETDSITQRGIESVLLGESEIRFFPVNTIIALGVTQDATEIKTGRSMRSSS